MGKVIENKKSYIYIANGGYLPSLVKVQIKKETPKRYIPVWRGYEVLFGWSRVGDWRSYIAKDAFRCFDIPEDALEYLRAEAKKYVAYHEEGVKEAQANQKFLDSYEIVDGEQAEKERNE